MTEKSRSDIVDEFRSCRYGYELFTADVEQLVKRLLAKTSIKLHKIESRTKEIPSLREKVDREGKSYEKITEITDLSGVRIISFFVDDVASISELIESEFEIDWNASQDKLKVMESDRFGYVSVHYVVSFTKERLSLPEYKSHAALKCEIQIRSITQHAWAEIEHDLVYKSNATVPSEIIRPLSRLSSLFELADDEFLRIRELKRNYAKDVQDSIRSDKSDEVSLNLDSVKVAIDESKIISSIEKQITERLGASVSVERTPDFFLEKLVLALRNLGVDTIGNLAQRIEQQNSNILKFAVSWINLNRDDGDGPFPIMRGTSLLYLMYSILMTERTVSDATEVLSLMLSEEGAKLTAHRIFEVWDEIK